MKVRGNTYHPPGPFCPGGHRRTASNTRWSMTYIAGHKYVQIRCRICEAERYKRYYQKRKLEAAE